MIIELGNHSAHRGIDDAPKVTQITIPDFDDGSTHPDAKYDGPHPHDAAPTGKLLKAGPRLGGYTHEPGGISVKEFRDHLADAIINRNGITRLPGHEALLSIVSAWPTQAREKPAWVNVVPEKSTPKGHADDVQGWLEEFYGIDKAKPGNFEDIYWTRFGPPGQGGPWIPDHKALFTNVGRVQQAQNYGGGQVGATGQASASSSTTLTTTTTAASLNCYAGYRVYATVNATTMVWGNIVSNTNGANTVLTVDRWYNSATPGGSAGSTPSATGTYLIADGGVVSAWFVGLTTTNITPAAADVSLSGEYTTASGGYLRKIAPYALTSGTSPMSYTLIPVFTGNGSDTYPSTFFAIGVFTSMVVGAGVSMKFETTLNASATVAATGDQITVTETGSGS